MTDLPALRAAIFAALAKADGFEPEQLEPDDYETQIAAVVPLVLAARTTQDARVRTAVLTEASGKLRLELFPAVYEDAGQRTAEGVRRAADELDRMAAVSAPGGVRPPCNCGHDKAQHDAGQCRVCPGDSENTWQHPYTPTSR